MRCTLSIVLVGLVAVGVPASAHHSFPASYFEDQTVSIEGELVEFEYRAPHAWVRVMAPDDKGVLQQFSAEWANPSRLAQLGVTKETLKAGDRVIVTGSPGRNPTERRIHLKSIQRPADGWAWKGRGGGR
jgi:hypothetical protein